MRARRNGLIVCGLGVILAACPVALAEEPTRAFLDGLRERGYHDVALDYLESMATSPLAPLELKEVIDLEKAVTMIAASRTERDSEIRIQRLNEAQELLRKFIREHAQHMKLNVARTQLGNLIVERARLKVDDSKKGNSQPILAEAKELYEEAYKVFGEQQADVRAQLEKFPKVLDVADDEQAKLAERRTQLRADYLQTLLLAAAIREETADTVPAEAKQYRELLTEAAQQYEEIYKKYRTRLAGLYARMFQGRVNQKLDKFRDALGFYVELLDQPDSPEEFRILKTKTLRLAMDCWLDPSQKKYFEAIRRGAEWTMKARPAEERDPDWLYIRLGVARAYLMQAEAAANEKPPNGRLVTRSRNESRKHAQAVAQHESEFRRDAQQLVAELGGSGVSDDSPVVQNFAQARKAGSDAFERITPTATAMRELQKQFSAATGDAKDELQQRVQQAQQELDAARHDALEFFRLALTLADRDTPSDDVNLVRYLLSYLYFNEQMYYDAALIGEFVARRNPDSTSARQCAQIAMACYLQLYSQDPASEKHFETERVISISQYIVDRWPGQAEAEDALATLIPFMINARELEDARRYLGQMSPNSPRQAASALKVGKAMWQTYLRKVQERVPNETAIEPGAAMDGNLDEWKTETRDILRGGLKGLAKDIPIDNPIITAILSLAQAEVETQQPQAAVAVLEDPTWGPLTLVRKNHPATKSEGFDEETYKTALRAYISSLATAESSEAAMQNARQIMDEMQIRIGSTPEGKGRLIAVYVGLARDLEEQLTAANPQTRQALSRGFETFLSQLSASADELNVLNWVAETFASLGAGFDTTAQLTPEARKYYEQSAAAFRGILDKVELTPDTRTQVKVRLAGVLTSQRRFDESLQIFKEILEARNMTLNVQVEAARALQDAGRYDDAMTGMFVDPATNKNVIWGWGRIAKVTASFPKFKDVFHQARYNLAKSRFQLAQTKQGGERGKLLGLAMQDISLTKRLYGLGDENWTKRYDTLLKQIQAAKGDPPIGVGALG
jgi:hypothetical protein